MAAISLGGVNLDVSGIVSQLMDIESRPLAKLQQQETNYNSQLSELGRLKSALSTFQSSMDNLSSLSKFETYKASNSEDSSNQSYTTTVDENAVAGIYSIDVISLASVNKLGQTPGGTTFDAATPPYTGTDTLDLNDGSNNISVDIKDKTIAEVRDAINAEAEANGAGLSASIIQTGTDTFQLVVTATETGTANQVNITNANGASAALGLVETQAASDGIVKIDGYVVTSSSNTIEGAIEGVTLNLKQLNPSADPAVLTISRDTASVTSSIKSFINSYNSLMSSIKIYESGALEGDSTLDAIKNSFRNQLNTSSDTGAFNFLSEIGVTSNAKTGALELDSDVLDKAMSSDFEAISKLFAEKDKGIAYRLDSLVDGYLSFDGIIKGKEDGINSRLRLNSADQDNMGYRLEAKEAAYLKQYSALDVLIGKMNSTSESLAGQLASLPGFTS
ncbi:MAG: flagellar filament capping protein FliD [Pseudomonadota bacterium]